MCTKSINIMIMIININDILGNQNNMNDIQIILRNAYL